MAIKNAPHRVCLPTCFKNINKFFLLKLLLPSLFYFIFPSLAFSTWLFLQWKRFSRSVFLFIWNIIKICNEKYGGERERERITYNKNISAHIFFSPSTSSTLILIRCVFFPSFRSLSFLNPFYFLLHISRASILIFNFFHII